MGKAFFHPPSPLHCSTFSALSRSWLRMPFFSLKEIASKASPLVFQREKVELPVASVRAYGNRREGHPEKNPTSRTAPKEEKDKDLPSSDGKVSVSSNKEEILALFRRIQSSISEGGSANYKKKGSRTSEDKPSAESILEVLRQSRTRPKGKSFSKKGDKFARKDFQNKEQRAEYSSDAKLTSSRPPSSFSRKSPIPSQSSLIDKVEPKPEVVSTPVPSLSSPGEKIELKTEVASTSDNENGSSPKKYEAMKLAELKEVAKSRGIKGYSKLKKSELVELLIKL